MTRFYTSIHPGDVPAQLQLGPRPPVGSGEPGVAGPGLGRWGRTRRRAIHHRPGLHHLRDLWSGQGRGPPPQLHRPAGAITWVCGSHSGSCWAKCPLSTIVVVRPSHGPPPVGPWQPLRRRQPLLRRNRRYAVTLWGWQQSWDTARFVSGRRIWPGPGPRAGAPPPPALPKPPENPPQSRQWFRPNSDGRRGR